MKPAGKIWINGKITSSKAGNIFAFHQGLNYGACVYDGIRFYKTGRGPAIFRLNDHLERFLYSASVLRMKLDIGKEKLEAAVKNLIRANKLDSGYIRPMAFYSEPKMGINILNSDVTLMILAWPWEDRPQAKIVTMKVVKYSRLSPKSVNLKAKIAGYYANGLLGFIEARESGFDEPLFLDENGFIAEGAVNNIFIVKNQTIFTPKSDNILDGVTRDTILKIAKDLKFKVTEKDLRLSFLKNADEIFLTGTGIELETVKEIGGWFKTKSAACTMTEKLQSYYRDITKGRIAEYKKWLTYL